MTNLTDIEKKNIADQHLKNLKLNEYNLQLSVLEEEATENPVQVKIDNLNIELEDIERKIAAIEATIALLNVLAE
jgi:hypothetical protein